MRINETKAPTRRRTPKFPEWLRPMAATLTQERFTGPEWIFERKFDGIRLLAFKNGQDVGLFSRNRLPQNIPSVAQAIMRLSIDELILDGEITWGGGEVTYHIFDVMWLDGRDLTSLPHNVKDVIRNLSDSLYEHRRSPHWLKMKCEMSQELVVGGFTDPQGKRVGLGALLVGYFDGGDLVFAGKIGTGFDTKLLLDLRAQLDELEITKTPFTKAVGLPRVRAHWVRPEIVVQVGFIEWTVHGKLRHPRLLGVKNHPQITPT